MVLSSEQMTVSVIIPVFRAGETLCQCLLSLTQSRPSPDEVIVVADGEGDGSWRLAGEFNALSIQINGPKGPACARNKGASLSHGNILFFIDSDVSVPPDTIGKVLQTFRNHPDLAAVIGSYDDDPAIDHFFTRFKTLFQHFIHQTAREEASTFWGACGAIRRDIFFALGGFDEKYRRPSIEDIELGYRIKKAGYRIHLSKTLQVKHLKKWSLPSLLRSDIFNRALPWTDLILRRRWLIDDLNLRTSSRLSVLCTFGLLVSWIGVKWWYGFFLIAMASILSLLTMNFPLYRFFYRRCGFKFTIMAIPLHWLYYFYSGLTFLICTLLLPFRHPKKEGRADDHLGKGRD